MMILMMMRRKVVQMMLTASYTNAVACLQDSRAAWVAALPHDGAAEADAVDEEAMLLVDSGSAPNARPRRRNAFSNNFNENTTFTYLTNEILMLSVLEEYFFIILITIFTTRVATKYKIQQNPTKAYENSAKSMNNQSNP